MFAASVHSVYQVLFNHDLGWPTVAWPAKPVLPAHWLMWAAMCEQIHAIRSQLCLKTPCLVLRSFRSHSAEALCWRGGYTYTPGGMQGLPTSLAWSRFDASVSSHGDRCCMRMHAHDLHATNVA